MEILKKSGVDIDTIEVINKIYGRNNINIVRINKEELKEFILEVSL